jgi:hypothetical protein
MPTARHILVQAGEAPTETRHGRARGGPSGQHLPEGPRTPCFKNTGVDWNCQVCYGGSVTCKNCNLDELRDSREGKRKHAGASVLSLPHSMGVPAEPISPRRGRLFCQGDAVILRAPAAAFLSQSARSAPASGMDRLPQLLDLDPSRPTAFQRACAGMPRRPERWAYP